MYVLNDIEGIFYIFFNTVLFCGGGFENIHFYTSNLRNWQLHNTSIDFGLCYLNKIEKNRKIFKTEKNCGWKV